MTLGNDDVIGVQGAVEVPPLAVEAVTEAYPGRHLRNSRLWPRRETLGRPRTSTMVLSGAWVAFLALYLEVRPG